jgi:hypothetical protein
MVSLLSKSTEKKDKLGEWPQGSVVAIAVNFANIVFDV